MSSAIVDAMREMAFRLSSDSVGVGRPINLAAMFVTRVRMTPSCSFLQYIYIGLFNFLRIYLTIWATKRKSFGVEIG